MCLNKLDNKGEPLNMNLFGDIGNKYRSIDINYIPCTPKKLTKLNKHKEKTDCIIKLDGTEKENKAALAKKFKESKEYLGRPAISIVGNNQRLDLEKFLSDGED
jgi:hypothetical protein